MKNILSVVIGLSVLAAGSTKAQANLLTLTNGTQTCEGRNVPASAVANFTDGQVTLTTAAFGLRAKKVAIVNAKVYCLELMVAEPALYAHGADAALTSLDKMSATALRLDFLRSVDAQTVKSSFADAFTANHVDMNSPMIAAFLNAVGTGGDAQSGKAMTIAYDSKSSTLYYEDTNGKGSSMKSDATTAHQILSIWLGVPADSGLATLKQQLTGN